MGIKSVNWFRSYLSNQNQIVNVNDTESDPSLVTCGVPQESILDTLLFLCYINDMELSISSECKLLIYADVSAILYSNKDSLVNRQTGLSPPVKYFTDHSNAVLLLWIFYVFFCHVFAFVRVCLYVPCGHLLGMG